jgi:regulator of protease activity HflC (stomatin/prohibitin superfamily)
VKTSAILALLAVLAGCRSHAPDAGHEIVLIQKPWFFGHGGVVDEPVTTGRTWVALSTSGIDVSMQPQRVEVDLPDTMTSDGVPISFHAVLTYQVTDAVRLVRDFGEAWYQNNLAQPFSTAVRQSVRKHGMNETAISTTAIEEIDTEIRDAVQAAITAQDLPIRLITLTVGRANPPDSVKNQRVETAAQQQRIETEKQKKLAEDQRMAAEQSRAAADNAYRQAMQLSPEQFLQLETIKMQAAVCGPEGRGTCTFIQNGATPVYNLGR